MWEAETGRLLRTFEGHTEKVNSVCFSPDGQRSLSGSRDGTLKLWEVPTGRCLRTFDEHTDGVRSVCLDTRTQYALSGSEDGTLKLWEVGAFGAEAKLRLGQKLRSADAVVASARYQSAVSGARSALVAGDDLGAWRLLRTARQPVGYRRATSGIREWFRLYDRLRKRSLRDCWPLWTFENSALSICVSADGQFTLSGSAGGTLKLREVASGRCLRTFEARYGPVNSVCLSPDGQYAMASENHYAVPLCLWAVATGSPLREHEGLTAWVNSVCADADWQCALSGSGDRTLKLWEIVSGRCLRTFEGHTDAVNSVCLSSDRRHALSGSSDTMVKLWNLASGRCLRTLAGHTNSVTSVCLSADGLYALSSSTDKTLKLWEVATGRCLRAFEGHSSPVNSVCLSTCGKYSLSGSRDKTLKLWEAATGRCLRMIEGLGGEVHDVCLSADGRHAFSVSDLNITAWVLDWELEANESADWDEDARPYLDVFLRAHRPYVAKLPQDRQPTEVELTLALTRSGPPVWSETEFQGLLYTLDCAGFGWPRPAGVRRELGRMTTASIWE